MSRVLTQAKHCYQKSIWIEMGILLIIGALISLWQWKSAVDFCLGFFCAFLPFCAFVYLIFYRKQHLSTKLTALAGPWGAVGLGTVTNMFFCATPVS